MNQANIHIKNNVYSKNFRKILVAHEKAGLILHSSNTKSEASTAGFAYIHYFEKKEVSLAKSFFKKLGITAWRGKKDSPTTLCFPLDFKSLQFSKIKKVERSLENESAISTFLYLFQHKYKKQVKTQPRMRVDIDGLSSLGYSPISIEEFDSVKRMIEKETGILCVSQINKKSTDFFIVTNEIAEIIYLMHGGLASAGTILKTLSNKTQVAKILQVKKELNIERIEKQKKEKQQKQINKIKQKMEEQNDSLSKKLKGMLKDSKICPVVTVGAETPKDTQIYMQLFPNSKENKVVIQFTVVGLKGEEAETKRDATISEVQKFLKNSEEKVTVNPGPKGTNLHVSIEGYVVPRKNSRITSGNTGTSGAKFSGVLSEKYEAEIMKFFGLENRGEGQLKDVISRIAEEFHLVPKKKSFHGINMEELGVSVNVVLKKITKK